MNSSEKDYGKLYHLQDKFLSWWFTIDLPFYLTGGTALGRFYLNHRFSEDLDFFTNADPGYADYITILKNKIGERFALNIQESLFTSDFTRFYIVDNGLALKIELVNNVAYYPGNPLVYKFGLIDQPHSILSNKLTAIAGRDEPKDIFDIIHLSLNYSFNWQDIFYQAKQKSVINEIDVEQRLNSFPVEWLAHVNWLVTPADSVLIKRSLQQIADDFLLGKDNSLGVNKIPIEAAKPLQL